MHSTTAFSGTQQTLSAHTQSTHTLREKGAGLSNAHARRKNKKKVGGRKTIHHKSYPTGAVVDARHSQGVAEPRRLRVCGMFQQQTFVLKHCHRIHTQHCAEMRRNLQAPCATPGPLWCSLSIKFLFRCLSFVFDHGRISARLWWLTAFDCRHFWRQARPAAPQAEVGMTTSTVYCMAVPSVRVCEFVGVCRRFIHFTLRCRTPARCW